MRMHRGGSCGESVRRMTGVACMWSDRVVHVRGRCDRDEVRRHHEHVIVVARGLKHAYGLLNVITLPSTPTNLSRQQAQ